MTETIFAESLATFTTLHILAAIAASLVCVAIVRYAPVEIIPPIWREPGAAGTMVRKLLPPVVLVPVVLGFLRVEAQRAGLIATELGAALMVVVTAVLLVGLVVRAATVIARHETQLREARAFLDAVIENIPNMVFVKDAERLAFTRVNKAAERLLGLAREQLIGKNDHDFFPEEQARFFVEKDRDTLRKGELVRIEEEKIQTADGERWLSTQKVPIVDDHGRPRFLLGISEDITERKRTADEIKKARDIAEATSRELEAFSYSVSHDLRAPLRGIDGFSQALLEDYGDKLDATGKMYLGRVRSAAQRMAQLIDDLLNLSKVTRAELRRERVDVSALANAVVADLRHLHDKRTVNVKVHDGLVDHADPRLLRVVFENLVGNAFKFTAKRVTATIEIGAATHEGERRYFVKDDGAGFDMAYSNKLFGAFQRLHHTTDFEGTGIGLATVKRIVTRHGGRIWAEGEVGKGATFYFTISGGSS